MPNLWPARVLRRALGYCLLAALSLMLAPVINRLEWRAGARPHTVLAAAAAVLALYAGVYALIRYYARRSCSCLVLGSGLIGTALVELYQAVIASPPSSGCASSQFCLAAMMCCGWRLEKPEKAESGEPEISETKVYLLAGGFTALSFLFIGLTPPWPAKLVSGALFAAALAGCLFRGGWKAGGFEHCRILMLITAVAAGAAYGPFSAGQYDAPDIAAHLLAVLGYAFIQGGLYHGTLAAFRREASAGFGLQQANEFLGREIRERERVEEELRLAKEELEARVAARTAELAERSSLAAMAAEVGAVLTRAGDTQQNLQRCAEIVVRRLDAALVRIWALDEGGAILQLRASAGIYTHLDGAHSRVPVGSKKIGMIASAKRVHFTNSVLGDPQVDQEWAAREGLAAFAGFPLVVEEATIGVLAVFARQAFTEHAVRSIESLANEISVGIGRKRAEDLASISRERFRIAAENASDVVWQCDPTTGQLRSFGSAGAAVDADRFPQSLEALRAILHPEDRERVMASLEGRHAAGDVVAEEYRTLGPDGEVRYWSSRATALEGIEAEHEVWIGASSDITARMQRALALSQLAAIVESSEAAIVTVNLEGMFEIWNSAAERIFGYTQAEVAGRHFSILLPPERAGEQAEILKSVIAGQSVRNRETVRMRKDGERVAVMVSVSPVRDSTGTITASAAIMNDITRRKLLERQLAQAQKLESIGQLAAGIAHEINTPVQFIGDNIRFLRDALTDVDSLLGSYHELLAEALAGQVPAGLASSLEERERAADLEYLRTEIPVSIGQSLEGVSRIAAIVKAIREFSHPGSTDKTLVDLNLAVENTAVVSRNEWKYVAELRTYLEPGLPLVLCIPGEVNQVMLNLIVNASHAIADKVAREPDSKGLIIVSTRSDAGWVEIRVEDNGTGIPESARAHVFDPFFTTKAVGKGTGQGLAIAHNVIVQKHQGEIRFETETGCGSTFIIRLPIDGAQCSAPDVDRS